MQDGDTKEIEKERLGLKQNFFFKGKTHEMAVRMEFSQGAGIHQNDE